MLQIMLIDWPCLSTTPNGAVIVAMQFPMCMLGFSAFTAE